MTRAVREWWKHTADEFQETADVSVGINWGWEELKEEGLLGDISGTDVLELGCGGGQDTVALARRGANVTGIDLSGEQLRHAAALIETRTRG